MDTPSQEGPRTLVDWVLRGLIIAGLLVIFYGSLAGSVFQPLFHSIQNAHWSKIVLRPSALWGLTGSIFLACRTFLWFRYRPFPSATPVDAPSLTVIIPAYNEGRMVEKAIYSVLSADYPQDRLQVLVVDDGSIDDTWHYIQKAAAGYPQLVTPLRFTKNKGKRKALEEGFRHASGEMVLTLDSDSVIERGTLLAMMGPFRDPQVGAVAGKVLVYNQNEGIIPKMLQVRYVLSFDFLRAVQSTYGTVYCCPGALAAYRTSVVRSVLDRWVQQRFLGIQCTYGEDRAMTNFILSSGYNAVYQRSGKVHTLVPEAYRKLCKMYLRWDRSYIRETIHFARIVWKRPFWARLISLADLLITNMRYPVGWASLFLFATLSISDPTTILRLFCAIGLFATLNLAYYLYSERSWLFLYGILYAYFSFLALFWVFPYALLTVRTRAWGTR
ncbi:MAG: Poly-beta-1,6-N-acetyl-D-glucosamine synthase [Syntrophorhabdus sp. PtaU1.Bin058]|nr:MAG: Poly-beta-1,6-N-acetyl-D-glucosamine synthase [Syntrophorhabdus sp. PtaU1.Bin058]